MHYGIIYRNLRKGKKKTLDDIVRETDFEVSKSFLSKFERGESDISFYRLRRILNALNVSLDEFTSLLDDTQNIDDIEAFLDIASSHYYQKDTKALSTLILKETQAFQITQNNDHNYKAILAKVFCHDLRSESLSDEDIQILSDYLFGIEYWSKYELIILTNCITFMHHETAITLTNELIKKNHLFGNLLENLELKVILLINTSINCLKNNQKDRVNTYIQHLDDLNLSDHFLQFKLIIKLLKIITSDSYTVEKAKEEITSIISFLDLMDASHSRSMVIELTEEYFCPL